MSHLVNKSSGLKYGHLVIEDVLQEYHSFAHLDDLLIFAAWEYRNLVYDTGVKIHHQVKGENKLTLHFLHMFTVNILSC